MKETDKLGRYRAKRDFSRTSEPKGGARKDATEGLAFVVQKHAASHLHYDLRLEVGGVMKSWAVPKGPNLDPSVKRLAMEVEDHPIEYNSFEGTIPKGEYGGGTVMLWDVGSYAVDELEPGETPEEAMERGHRAGKLAFTMRGERLRGSFTLVRTRGSAQEERSQWLLIKHDDEYAKEGAAGEITRKFKTSVTTGRTMDEITAGKGGGRVWRSNRGQKGEKPAEEAKQPARTPSLPGGLEPMLARSGGSAPEGKGWTYEPKYDGIRVLAFATESGAAMVTRNGNEKARQFPEIAEALRDLAVELGRPVVLDGEIVALEKGRIVRFEALQTRMNVKDASRVAGLAREQPAALVVFDLLLEGEEVLLPLPWTKRRAALEKLLEGRTGARIVLGETSGNRAALLRRAEREGWEGLIAKRADSRYLPGSRTGDWMKLKIEHQQEFVVGGWTEPRRSREHLGALLLGYYQDGKLIYAGHTGTGFTRDSLREMMKRLKPLARKTSPFATRPVTNEVAHWVRPALVVEVRFNEWTSEGKLRQPVFLGVRDDKDPKSVVRERSVGDPDEAPPLDPAPPPPPTPPRRGAKAAAKARAGAKIPVTNPEKVFFPGTGETKGEVLDYYNAMAPYILPWMEDRPLVLKRYPNGIEGEAFYQQAAPERVPAGVRVEDVAVEGEAKPRLVGGDLATLLYTVQIGAISYDPWHSRIDDLTSADYSIIDLDPGPGATFARVVEVALRVREELDHFGLHGALKTSGSRGLHIYLPLPPGTPLEASTLLAQIVATRTSRSHPKIATIERMTKRRPRGTVYVDYLQNILGKTVAGVYAVRAKPGATVSAPIAWEELTDELRMEAFTLRTMATRMAEVGDLWAPAMARTNSLEALLREGAA
jgi:bifunctional non-homologous end joining protein LigD